MASVAGDLSVPLNQTPRPPRQPEVVNHINASRAWEWPSYTTWEQPFRPGHVDTYPPLYHKLADNIVGDMVGPGGLVPAQIKPFAHGWRLDFDSDGHIRTERESSGERSGHGFVDVGGWRFFLPGGGEQVPSCRIPPSPAKTYSPAATQPLSPESSMPMHGGPAFSTVRLLDRNHAASVKPSAAFLHDQKKNRNAIWVTSRASGNAFENAHLIGQIKTLGQNLQASEKEREELRSRAKTAEFRVVQSEWRLKEARKAADGAHSKRLELQEENITLHTQLRDAIIQMQELRDSRNDQKAEIATIQAQLDDCRILQEKLRNETVDGSRRGHRGDNAALQQAHWEIERLKSEIPRLHGVLNDFAVHARSIQQNAQASSTRLDPHASTAQTAATALAALERPSHLRSVTAIKVSKHHERPASPSPTPSFSGFSSSCFPHSAEHPSPVDVSDNITDIDDSFTLDAETDNGSEPGRGRTLVRMGCAIEGRPSFDKEELDMLTGRTLIITDSTSQHGSESSVEEIMREGRKFQGRDYSGDGALVRDRGRVAVFRQLRSHRD